MAARIGEVNYKISWKQGSKIHQKIVHINKFKLFVDSDSLPCHKVLTVLDQQVNQQDDPFIPDQFKLPDLSDTMKSELDNVFLQFSQKSLVTPHWQNIQSKVQLLHLFWSPVYINPVHIEAKFMEELDNLVYDGVIEEIDSLLCSTPIPVNKKDMSIRMLLITGN